VLGPRKDRGTFRPGRDCWSGPGRSAVSCLPHAEQTLPTLNFILPPKIEPHARTIDTYDVTIMLTVPTPQMRSASSFATQLGRVLGATILRIADLLALLLRSDFFISYSRSDGAAYAGALRDELKCRGLKCRMDTRDFYPGQTLSKTTQANLRRSSALIVVLTPKAIESVHVAREIDFFAGLRRPIIPIDIHKFFDALDPNSRWRHQFENLIRLSDSNPTHPDKVLLAELERSITFLRYRSRVTLLLTVLGSFAMLLLYGYNVRLARPELSREWSVNNNLERGYAEMPRLVSAALSSIGTVAVGTYDGNVYLIDKGDSVFKSLTGLQGYILRLAFTRDGRSLLGIGADSSQVVCWDSQTRLVRWAVANDQPVVFCALSDPAVEGDFYVADRKCVLWHIAGDGTILKKTQIVFVDDFVETISPGSTSEGALVCLEATGLAIVPETGAQVRFLKPQVRDPRAEYYGACRIGGGRIAFLAEESSISTVKDTRSLYLCDILGKRCQRLEASQYEYTSAISVPSSALFFTHSKSGRISLWSGKSGEELLGIDPYPTPWEAVSAIAYDSTNHQLCLVGGRSIEVWRLTWLAPWGFSLPTAERWK
jgi:WD40 repeat protein